MSLAISIPEKKVSAWIVETTVNGTEGWISQLPIADSVESARDLYQALYTLNRMELSPKNRFELMELYRQPVSQVSGQLQNRLSGSSYPLSAQRYRLAEFVRDLQVEMAYGYKLALFDLERQRRPLIGKSSGRARYVFRSMHYLGTTITRSMTCYLAYPGGIWQEIHSLYRFARENRCHLEPVTEFGKDGDKASSVEKRYKEILLLAFANPYRMALGQCRQVNAFVYRWADLVRLQPISELGRKKQGMFVIDLEQDSAGESAGRKKIGDNQSTDSQLLLDAVPLIEHVDAMLRRINTGTPVRDLDLGSDCVESACKDMLAAMLSAWKADQVRRNARIPIHGPASVCSGLTSIHHFVHQQNQQSQGNTPVLLGTPVNRRESGGDTGSPAFKVAKWDVVNASAGGALVKGRDQTGVSVRVGDLVALLDAGKQSQVRLFAVRWMKECGPGGLELGLELLSDKISSILVGQEHDGGSFVPALMLESVNSGDEKLPRTLVLRKDLRGKQKDIELLETGEENSRWVRVLDSIDHSGTYERVTFVSLSRRDK